MLTREHVFATLRKQMKDVLITWDEAKFNPEQSMSEMGIDSLDSVLVLLGSLKELGVKLVQTDQLQGRSLNQVVDAIVSEGEKAKSESTPAQSPPNPQNS
jgi:acyl carrier protein